MRDSLATVLERVADGAPDSIAVVQGGQALRWRDLDDRAAKLAGYLAARGVEPGSRVAVGLRNGAAYVETLFAVLKLRATVVNVNYRYREAELAHVLADSGACAAVLTDPLVQRVGRLGSALPAVRCVLRVGDRESPDGGSGGAVDVADAVAASPPVPRRARGDDEWLLYTSGSTGRPRAVVTCHSWVVRTCARAGFGLLGVPLPATLEELDEATRRIRESLPRLICLPAAPLVHGTGLYNTLGTLLCGGTVVFAERARFDPDEVSRLVDTHEASDLVIVGDAFARPLADAWDRAAEAGAPYRLGSLRRVRSAGATWSAEVKARILAHADVTCMDTISATEGGPFATAATRRGDGTGMSRFRLASGARLVGPGDRDVVPGSSQVGVLAAPTDERVHYLGDPDLTARTFRVLDGVRYAMPGDLATLSGDGTLTLLGRGSQVINTGGEKVFAAEVEQVLLQHPDIEDAVVVGVPDERWGQRVAAVVVPVPGQTVTGAGVRQFVGGRLADHKRPRTVAVVPQVRRSPAGKVDLRWAAHAAASAPAPGDAPDFPFPRPGPFDLPTEYAQLRTERPVCRVTLWDGSRPWLITRYGDARALLTDARLSADSRKPGYPTHGPGLAATRRKRPTFIAMDRPDHSRYRRMVSGEFTARRIAGHEERIQRIVDHQLDEFVQEGPPADLVDRFAVPVPCTVISHLLGIPDADHRFFQDRSRIMMSGAESAEAALRADDELCDYLGGLLRVKQSAPADDILSRLATRWVGSGALSVEEAANMARLLLVAGHETTTNMIALGALAVMRFPRLRSGIGPDTPAAAMAAVVEELLRHLSIAHFGRRRVATHDIDLHGEVIAAGEGVVVAVDSANRDPEVFPDPDLLDGHRDANHHLAFGHGPHQCLGQELARLELRLALATLLRRLPTLRLAVPVEQLRFKDSMVFYGVETLPVTW